MVEKRSFAQILEDKMSKHRQPLQSTETKTQAAPSAWGTYELPFFAQEERHFRPKNNPYPKRRRPQTKPIEVVVLPPEEEAPQRPVITFWQLSPTGQQAFHRFNQLGGMLGKDDICPADLKKEYRRLAKVYHPDRRQSDPDANGKFIKLKKLESLLTRELSKILAEMS